MLRSFEFASDLGFDIYAVDTGFVRPEFDASYIVANRNKAGTGLEMSLAVIDVGPNAAVSRILQTIQELGCQSTQVAYLILTHIHLDHAGGAGLLMQKCPNAKLIVHPRGARHMIDPSALIASALAVHGKDHVDQEYGRILPIPATRVIETFDGLKIDLDGRVLECFATPGHAKPSVSATPLEKPGVAGPTDGLRRSPAAGRGVLRSKHSRALQAAAGRCGGRGLGALCRDDGPTHYEGRVSPGRGNIHGFM